ncbi:MAG: O-antigen ligase family protein [Nitrospirae bacterium]|nr:O-antigen ligase family protein [Nitrospirota bacterium]
MTAGSLLAVVIASALLFGAVEPWSLALVAILASYAFISFAFSARKPDGLFREERALGLSLGAVLLYPLFQLLPLPVAALDLVHRTFGSVITIAPDHVPAFHSISLYPFATETAFARLLIYVMVFSVAAFGTGDTRRAYLLMKALAVFGFSLALFGVIQHATWNGKIYWFRELTQGGTPFGPFVNRNHFAGFIGMIIPLSLGVAFRSRTMEDRVLYGFFALVMAIGLFFSLSRGGIVSFFGGLLVFSFLSLTKGKSKKWLIPVFVFAVVLAVYLLFLGISPVLERFAKTEVSGEQRLAAWQGTLAAFRDFPLFGSGLGTFQHIFKVYQPDGLYSLYDHAHNDYLELLLEAGLFGTVLAALAMFFMLRVIVNIEWTGRNLYTGAALLASITTIAIHSLVDFNLHIPSNAILFSLILGLGVFFAKGEEQHGAQGMEQSEQTEKQEKERMMKNFRFQDLEIWKEALQAVTVLLFFVLVSHAYASVNLIPNPDFSVPAWDGLAPHFWHHGESAVEGVKKSGFSVGMAGVPPLRALGITGGEDRSGEWRCAIEGLEKGKRYRLSLLVFRESYVEGAFPSVELFGRKIRMSNLLSYGAWQDFGVVFTAPAESTTLRLINDYPVTFYFSSPGLVKMADAEARHEEAGGKEQGAVMPGHFPLVAYGAAVGEFSFIRELGFDGVVLGLNVRNAEGAMNAAAKAGLGIVASVRDGASIKKIASLAVSSASSPLLGWYVEDEPEGRSVPAVEITARVKEIRAAGSSAPAFMAMVRPEFIRGYRDAADVVLMDQYPIPHNPIIWLSRSMDEAAYAGAKNVWAVIQIFGGRRWKGQGWDREPTYEEMKALSYLAIVHGAKGLFFYTVKGGNYDLGQEPGHLKDVKRLLQELKYLSPCFRSASAGSPGFISDSLYQYAPDGTRPVHARIFRDGKLSIIVAVNVLDREVRGRLTGIGKKVPWLDEYFSGKRYVVKGDNIVDSFLPYEVKLYVAGREFRKVKIVDGTTGRARGEFSAEVAETEFEKTAGLMFRDLPSDERVLLFPHESAGKIVIHALNTKSPFDLLFVDERDRIASLFRKVLPCDRPQDCWRYTSPAPSRMVIELRGGAAEKFGIKEGDRVELY